MSKKIDKCPYCGSTTGYQYVYTVEYLQQVDFDGEPISAEQTGNGKEFKTKECIECKKTLNKYLREN